MKGFLVSAAIALTSLSVTDAARAADFSTAKITARLLAIWGKHLAEFLRELTPAASQ